jgi:hypothetical protein
MLGSNNNHHDNDRATSSSVVQDEMGRILQVAGITNEPMDPLSLEALKGMILEKKQQQPQQQQYGEHHDKDRSPAAAFAAAAATTAASAASSIRNPNNNSSNTFKKPPALPPFRQPPPPPPVVVVPATTTNTNTNTPTDRMIEALSQQIRYQTDLMLHMQQQIVDLKNRIDAWEGPTGSYPPLADSGGAAAGSHANANAAVGASPSSLSTTDESNRSFSFSRTRIYLRPSLSSEDEVVDMSTAASQGSLSPTDHPQHHRVIHQRRVVVIPPPAGGGAAGGGGNGQGEQHPPQQQPPQQAQGHQGLMFPLALYPVRALVWYIQYEYDVLKELYRMAQQDVLRNINGTVLFQLCFVLLVLSSRISPTVRQYSSF